ncbi:DDE domain protein [Burkholderia pseudomallei MSHR2990]|nr:DDE domain protein [Burkholderia pseudomallei MSHR2990]
MRKTPTRNHRSLTKARLLPLPADQVQRSSHMMHDFARCQRRLGASGACSRRWTEKFGAAFAYCVKTARRRPGSTWHLDEVFVGLPGKPYILWRAVDQHGIELDILLQRRRDKTAAKCFFKHVLSACTKAPKKIVTVDLT